MEKHSSWNETLLIVTADHDNSMPMGPDAQTVPFQPVENRGRGRMPGISFRPTGEHSNALVPLWAMGAGAEGFERRIRGRDAGFARTRPNNQADPARLGRCDIAGQLSGRLYVAVGCGLRWLVIDVVSTWVQRPWLVS